MASLQDQPAAIRWPVRIGLHALDNYAWVGSAVAAGLAVAWLVQSQLGVSVPASWNRAIANLIAYWSGPASVILLIGILIQASARAGMDEQREGSALSQVHIDDLHAQASAFKQRMFQPYSYVALNLYSTSARNFSQHFPPIAEQLRVWNGEAEQWQEAMTTLSERSQREENKPLDNGRPVQMSGVMQAVAMGNYTSPLDVRWSVVQPAPGGVYNLGFHDPNTQQDITVATIPGDGDPIDFARAVQQRLIEASNWPEAVRLRNLTAQLNQLRATLSQALDEVLLNHSPGGHCDTCRPLKTARK